MASDEPSRMQTETYTCETWLRGADGENVLLSFEERRSPFPLYGIGTPVKLEGAEPKSYTVRENYIGVDDRERRYPLRQTLIVD
jgi:hypothetical protein